MRLTIVSPGGEVEMVDLAAGDLSFIPRAYFHHIENLSDEEAHLAIFFDHELPAVFGRPAGTFDSLPRFPADVLLSPEAQRT